MVHATKQGEGPRRWVPPVATATAIGSLPHRDRAAALALVLDELPDLPAAPTLPRLDPREGMLAQAAWGMPGVSVERNGELVVSPGHLEPALPLDALTLDGPPFETLRAFLAAARGRTAPIKVQLTGPVTLGSALVGLGAPPEVAYVAALAAVRSRSQALVAAAREAAPEAPLVFFLDEPGLVATAEGNLPIAADTVVDLVSGALAVAEPDALTGVHCCGEADWRLVLQAGASILSLPAAAALEPAAGGLVSFLERGGWLAWGAVPTHRPIGDSPARLWRELALQWSALERAGADPVVLRRRSLLTPECGLAGHDPVQAEHVLGLTRRLAARLHDQVVSIQLSVGA